MQVSYNLFYFAFSSTKVKVLIHVFLKEKKPKVSKIHHIEYQSKSFFCTFWKFRTVKIPMDAKTSIVMQSNI